MGVGQAKVGWGLSTEAGPGPVLIPGHRPDLCLQAVGTGLGS